MKIKLVTFAPHPNFGTCLQSYALNYVLRKMGHDVEFIYNGRENPPLSFCQCLTKGIKAIVKRLLPEEKVTRMKQVMKRNEHETNKVLHVLSLPHHPVLNLLNQLFGRDAWYEFKKLFSLQWRKVYQFAFLDNNFRMRRIYTHKQYDEVVADADLIITGSDQIWNPYCGGYNPMMFLEFVNDRTKCVAYSSSISQPDIHPIVKERMKAALEKFSHIAVREQRSVDLLKALLVRDDIHLVVDPTYLLSAKEWELFSNKAVIEFILPERYIFCYFVGDKRAEVYEQMVQDVKRFTGIEDVITLECYNRSFNYGNGRLYRDAGPYEWVFLLRNASYICMDSFHATVLALKFQKEFVHTMKNEDSETGSQNTRMYDILSRYGILYKNYVPNGGSDWQRQIDYHRLTPLIENEIKDSMDYLKFEIEN